MREIQFVYFDIDDTLLDHRKAQERALIDAVHHFHEHFNGIDMSRIQEVYRTHNAALWRTYAAGRITREQLREQRFSNLLSDLSITTLAPAKIGDFYMKRYAHYWEYCAGARDVFLQIADEYPVGVLTNGFAEVQRAKLARFSEIRDRLTTTVISEEFGVMKPHPELFRYAAKQARSDPESILYVGDSYASDIEGGLKAGWRVIWYAPHASPTPEGIDRIRHWDELLDRLPRFNL